MPRTARILLALIAGPEPAQSAEDAYFSPLERAKQCAVDGNTLTLKDDKGNELLVFGKK